MWKKFIDKNLVIFNPEVKDKKSLFEGMVNHVYNQDYILNKKNFLEALQERETVSNTELSPGIAFPHARSDSVTDVFLCIVLLKEGLDYGNPDMGPVNIVFFFGCSPGNVKQYLQMLAKSSRLLRNKEFKQRLLDCNTAEEVIELLMEYSTDKDSSGDDSSYLMLLTLHKVEALSEVMSSLVEAGITNASVVESSSMAKRLAYDMPIFAGLSYMAQGKSKKSSMIFATLDNREQVDELPQLLKENGIDLNEKGVGFIQLIKVDSIIGNMDEDIEL